MTIRQLLVALPLLVLGWLAVLVTVGLVSDAAPGFVVLFPSARFAADLAPDFAVLGSSPISLTVAVDTPETASRLYQAGAWIVLPAGLPGCLPLPAKG